MIYVNRFCERFESYRDSDGDLREICSHKTLALEHPVTFRELVELLVTFRDETRKQQKTPREEISVQYSLCNPRRNAK